MIFLILFKDENPDEEKFSLKFTASSQNNDFDSENENNTCDYEQNVDFNNQLESIIFENSRTNTFQISESSKNYPNIKTKHFQHNQLESENLKLILQHRYQQQQQHHHQNHNNIMSQQQLEQRLPHSIMKNSTQKLNPNPNLNQLNGNQDYSSLDNNNNNNINTQETRQINISDQSSPSSATYNIYASNSPLNFTNDINTSTTIETACSGLLSSNILGLNNNSNTTHVASLNVFQNNIASSSTQPLNQKPKVRFNLDINYEKEREWNRVNKIIGDASKSQIEWTQEVEV